MFIFHFYRLKSQIAVIFEQNVHILAICVTDNDSRSKDLEDNSCNMESEISAAKCGSVSNCCEVPAKKTKLESQEQVIFSSIFILYYIFAIQRKVIFNPKVYIVLEVTLYIIPFQLFYLIRV